MTLKLELRAWGWKSSAELAFSRADLLIIIPALAGFQSEHEVEIPFMLTTRIAKVAARGSKRLFIGGVWGCSSNWKCSGEGFS